MYYFIVTNFTKTCRMNWIGKSQRKENRIEDFEMIKMVGDETPNQIWNWSSDILEYIGVSDILEYIFIVKKYLKRYPGETTQSIAIVHSHSQVIFQDFRNSKCNSVTKNKYQ